MLKNVIVRGAREHTEKLQIFGSSLTKEGYKQC
jgi:hypothetical protein